MISQNKPRHKISLEVMRVLSIGMPPLERLHRVRETFTRNEEYDDGQKALQARQALNRACPECAKQRVQKKRMEKFLSGGNTLAKKYPELIEEWDFERNKNRVPENTTPYSN